MGYEDEFGEDTFPEADVEGQRSRYEEDVDAEDIPKPQIEVEVTELMEHHAMFREWAEEMSFVFDSSQDIYDYAIGLLDDVSVSVAVIEAFKDQVEGDELDRIFADAAEENCT